MKHLIMISALAISLVSCGEGSTSKSTESTSSDSSSTHTTAPVQNGGGVTGDGSTPATITDSSTASKTVITPANGDSAASVKSHSSETHKTNSTEKKKK